MPFSTIILPNAPVAEVSASEALVFILWSTLPSAMETALVVVLPMSMPIVIFSPACFLIMIKKVNRFQNPMGAGTKFPIPLALEFLSLKQYKRSLPCPSNG
jgi:hypothetical protein